MEKGEMKKVLLIVILLLVLAFFAFWFQQWQKADRPFQAPDTSELTDDQSNEIDKRQKYLEESDRGLDYFEEQNNR